MSEGGEGKTLGSFFVPASPEENRLEFEKATTRQDLSSLSPDELMLRIQRLTETPNLRFIPRRFIAANDDYETPGGFFENPVVTLERNVSKFLRADLHTMLQRCMSSIERATDINQRLTAIVRAIKEMITIHYFEDANHRVFALALLNYLLIHSGFNSICVLKNSRIFFRAGTDEIVDQLKANMFCLPEDLPSTSLLIKKCGDEVVSYDNDLCWWGFKVGGLKQFFCPEEIQALGRVRALLKKNHIIKLLFRNLKSRIDCLQICDPNFKSLLTEKALTALFRLSDEAIAVAAASPSKTRNALELLGYFDHDDIELFTAPWCWPSVVTQSEIKTLSEKIDHDLFKRVLLYLIPQGVTTCEIHNLAKNQELDVEDFCKMLLSIDNPKAMVQSLMQQLALKQRENLMGQSLMQQIALQESENLQLRTSHCFFGTSSSRSKQSCRKLTSAHSRDFNCLPASK